MALPDGIKKYSIKDERPFITLRERSITFSKTAIEQLEYAPYVDLLIGEEKQIAVFQAVEKNEDSLPFYKEPKGKQLLVRLGNKKICAKLMNIAHIKAGKEGIRFYGEYLKEDHAIVIDLSKPF